MAARLASTKSDAQEGDSGGARCQGIVNAISHVDCVLRIALGKDADQAFGIGLGARHILDGDDVLEEAPDAATFQGMVEFGSGTASEDGQLRAPGEPLEVLAGQEPFFAGHVTRTVIAPIQLDELALYFFVFEFSTERLNPGRGKIPIVVEARLILPVLHLSAGHPLAGKELHGFQGGAMEGATHVHQNAVHVEDDDLRMEFPSLCSRFQGWQMLSGGKFKAGIGRFRPTHPRFRP